MNASSPQPESIFKRVLLLYGAYMLLNNGAYLVGFYLLPEGFMRGSPQTATARLVDSATSFGTEFTLTLLFNLGMVALLGMLLNLTRSGDPYRICYSPGSWSHRRADCWHQFFSCL